MPDFNPWDVVKCKRDFPPTFTAGSYYTIKESEDIWGVVKIVECDNGMAGQIHRDHLENLTVPGLPAPVVVQGAPIVEEPPEIVRETKADRIMNAIREMAKGS